MTDSRRGFPLAQIWLVCLAVSTFALPACATGPEPDAEQPAVMALPAASAAEDDDVRAILRQDYLSGYHGVLLSPDGRRVIYFVRGSTYRTDGHSGSWRVADITPDGLANERKLPLPADGPVWAMNAEWRDDSTLSYFRAEGPGTALYQIEVDTGVESLVLSADALGEGTELVPIGAWSRDGSRYAVVGKAATLAPLPEGGVPFDIYAGRRALHSVYVVDITDRSVRRVTGDDVPVFAGFLSGLAWSPDGSGIAFVIDPHQDLSRTDIAVVDVISGEVSIPLAQAGGEKQPAWSPDGRHLAFLSQRGQEVYTWYWGAVLDLQTGEVSYSDPDGRGFSGLGWLPDSSAYLGTEPWEFQRRLVAISADGGEAKRVGGFRDGLVYTPTHGYGFARDGSFVFIEETPVSPPQLFVSQLTNDGQQAAPARRISEFGGGRGLEGVANLNRVDWRSEDDRFDVSGILLTPAAATGPVPLIVNLQGGPSQITAGYLDSAWPGLVQAAVQRGYGVFTPTSRGRAGFGEAFNAGIRTSQSALAAPFSDVRGGINQLVASGVADPDKIALVGHSYGGGLTAFAITEQDFAAAVLHEPAGLDLTGNISRFRSGRWEGLLVRDLVGLHDPYDDEQQLQLIRQSAQWRVDEIATPVLLHCGMKSLVKECENIFIALRSNSIPAEYFVYDEGHVFSHPEAQYNDVVRTLAFLDHWISKASANAAGDP